MIGKKIQRKLITDLFKIRGDCCEKKLIDISKNRRHWLAEKIEVSDWWAGQLATAQQLVSNKLGEKENKKTKELEVEGTLKS